ncbi:hypothetical protein [Indiicoccus explosivorum]|uniref:hypothetical protein n=1 Tax=Indiicoccus explosivorum TaxID=1917864 RepID=UPI000B4331DE|nr:hypothetical protein [Indiicoccus explosivorum]
MDERKYEEVLAAIPRWEPSREQRVFGVSAIQTIIGGTFMQAHQIRKRLEREGKLPEQTW